MRKLGKVLDWLCDSPHYSIFWISCRCLSLL